MKKSSRIMKIIPAALAFMAMTGMARAASPFLNSPDVGFSGPYNHQAAKIAKTVYADAVAGHKGKLETALIDLRHNGVAAIAVRFDYPGFCNGKSCFTTILSDLNGQWIQVFAQHLKTLQVGAAPKNVPGYLLVDHTYVWQPVADHYVPSINGYISGKPMAPDHVPTGTLLNDLNKTYKTSGKKAWLASSLSAGSAGTLYAVQGSQVPASMTEGPFMLWSQKYGTVLRTTSHGLFGISDTTHDGAPNIVVSTDQGLEFYRWDGKTNKYVEYRTSFVSNISPAP